MLSATLSQNRLWHKVRSKEWCPAGKMNLSGRKTENKNKKI